MSSFDPVLYGMRVKYSNIYHRLGAGSYRVAYKVSDDLVLKVPLSDLGIKENLREHTLYTEGFSYTGDHVYGESGQWEGFKQWCRLAGVFSPPFAECTITYEDGIPLLLMEYVTRLSSEDEIKIFGAEVSSHRWAYGNAAIQNRDVSCPYWMCFIDNFQVGRNNAGKLVAYDYNHWV